MRKPQTLVVVLALAVLPARAQSKEYTADTKAIENIVVSWQAAWNSHDCRALSSLVAGDVDFVTVSGVWLKSQNEFEESHTRIHQMQMKESVLIFAETRIKFWRPDIAVVHARWDMRGDRDPDGAPRQPRQGIITLVVEKKSGRWLIIAAHNTNLRELSRQ